MSKRPQSNQVVPIVGVCTESGGKTGTPAGRTTKRLAPEFAPALTLPLIFQISASVTQRRPARTRRAIWARAVFESILVTETTSLGENTAVAANPADRAATAIPSGSMPDAELTLGERPAEPAAGEHRLIRFAELGLSEPILRAVEEMGYVHPTPIQQQAIPAVLMGRDLLGSAQTGTGKTAGFTLPMLDILSGSRARARMPRSLILEPTRELALQVAEHFVQHGKYLKLTHALIIGGESITDQRDALTRGVDVLIATPGRLLDIFERGGLLLSDARLLVIDEADRMLDMGFIPDVERIVGLLPRNRQTLLFSATMAPEIRRLADAFLQNPKEITVAPPASVATTIMHGLALVAEHDKREALRRLIRKEDVQNALIFCNRKRDVDILHKSLDRHGFDVGALHGDMSQPVRFATLEKFRASELRLLVCSDVAARGLDIGGLSHVFNFDVPHHAEDYVHRIGRTGRAGRDGRAFTLATPEDRLAVEAIEALIGMPIPRMAVEGLDPVGWSEAGGRRRGRGGRPGARAGTAKPRPAAAAPKPRRTTRAEPAEPRPQRSESGRQRGEPQPAPREPRRQRAAPPAPAPVAKIPGAYVPSRRNGRRSEADPGEAVRGFGEEVPGFMLIRPRPKRAVAAAPAPAEGADERESDA